MTKQFVIRAADQPTSKTVLAFRVDVPGLDHDVCEPFATVHYYDSLRPFAPDNEDATTSTDASTCAYDPNANLTDLPLSD